MDEIIENADDRQIMYAFVDELEDVLDQQFPKGQCKERGGALMVFAMAVGLAMHALEKQRKIIEEQ